jgi:hypothetical protein
MQLELGEAAPDGLSGKIFIALPDMEKTVVAGTFYAVLPQTAAPRGGGYNDAGN